MLAWPWSSGAGRGVAAWVCVQVGVGFCELLRGLLALEPVPVAVGGLLGLVRVRVAAAGFLVVAEAERGRPPVRLVGVVVPVVGQVPHRSQEPAADESDELDDRRRSPGSHRVRV
jgi:hypothetical protein